MLGILTAAADAGDAGAEGGLLATGRAPVAGQFA